jgi:hypothetical protein
MVLVDHPITYSQDSKNTHDQNKSFFLHGNLLFRLSSPPTLDLSFQDTGGLFLNAGRRIVRWKQEGRRKSRFLRGESWN